MMNDLDRSVQRVASASASWARDDARLEAAVPAGLLESAGVSAADEAARKALRALFANRWFDLAELVGAAVATRPGASVSLRRRYAQSLLEKSAFDPALGVLEQLERETVTSGAEREEVLGLTGRIHKQLFVRACARSSPGAELHLKRSIEVYLKSYGESPYDRSWSGINAVALILRARREGLTCAAPADPEEIARAVLANLETRRDTKKASVWDFASAAEACLALGRTDEAAVWLRDYCRHGEIDAFALGSTLRQFEEIWQVQPDQGERFQLVELLRSSLLARQNGAVCLGRTDVQATLERSSGAVLEKVFGLDGFVTYDNYRKGVERCRSVARIGREIARGEGTGFLMKASDLHPAWGDRAVLVTNAHVLGTAGAGALHPQETIVSFQAHDVVKPDEEFLVSEVLWSSPKDRLDVTVAVLDRTVPLEKPFPIAPVLPVPGAGARVLIVGHPGGGVLSFSLNDNELLDWEGFRVHYRAPTEGGSSGSPVFNQEWRLVAVHHAGSDRMPRLRQQGGTYQANEGISMRAVIEAIRQ